MIRLSWVNSISSCRQVVISRRRQTSHCRRRRHQSIQCLTRVTAWQRLTKAGYSLSGNVRQHRISRYQDITSTEMFACKQLGTNPSSFGTWSRRIHYTHTLAMSSKSTIFRWKISCSWQEVRFVRMHCSRTSLQRTRLWRVFGDKVPQCGRPFVMPIKNSDNGWHESCKAINIYL